MYLALRNHGSLNRIALTLFGYSTKRDHMDDPTIIGNKGSGLKLAALAAIRLSLKVVVSSTDAQGRYLLSYEVADTLAIPQIMLAWTTFGRNGSVEYAREPWNMTPQAFRDWDKPIGADATREFKMFREYIANAADEDKSFRMDRTDRIMLAPDGETAVFIQWSDGLARLLRESDRYFKFLGASAPVLVAPGYGNIYPKSEPDMTRLFVNGVMVECTRDPFMSSRYDYDLSNKTLVSEERIIRDRSRFMSELGDMLVEDVRDPIIATVLMRAVLEGLNVEAAAFATIAMLSASRRAFWREALARVVGTDKMCLSSGNPSIDADAEQVYGYHVVSQGISSQSTRFLGLIGIPNARDVAPTTDREITIPFSALIHEHRALFLREYRLLRKHFPDYVKWPYRLYADRTGQDLREAYCMLGVPKPEVNLYVVPDGDQYAFPYPDQLRAILLHEGRHLVTQKGDYDRLFMRAAEGQIDLLLARVEGQTVLPNGAPVPYADGTAAFAGAFFVEPGGTGHSLIMVLDEGPEDD